MFERARISTLLAWGFGIVIGLVVLMGLIIFHKSGSTADQAAVIAGDTYPKVRAATEIRFNIMRNWSNTLLLVDFPDGEEAKRVEAEMKANSQAITENFAFLEKNVRSDKGKQLLAASLKARETYTATRKTYLGLLKEGKVPEARRLLQTDLRSHLNAYIGALTDMIAFQAAKMDESTAAQQAEVASLRTVNIGISLLVLLVAIAASVMVSRTVQRILGGDAHYAGEVAREIASGNLGIEVRTSSGDTTSLLASIQLMRDRLRDMVGGIRAGAEQLGQAARQLAHASSAVASASAQQSEAASATAAAVEEMTVGVDHIARNAQEAQDFSRQAEALSHSGSEVIQRAAGEMEKIAVSVEDSSVIIGNLDQQSREISAVVSVIKEIADQTNLLALNAAIEAARAGEAGRGFAVVADEVRKLAERTSLSTQEIAQTIEKIQGGTRSAVDSMVAGVERVRSGTELARQAGEAIREIQGGAQQVAGVVSDISGSLREQSIASSEIAKNVENIARMIEENNASAGEAAVGASEVQRLAEQLDASIRSFRL